MWTGRLRLLDAFHRRVAEVAEGRGAGLLLKYFVGNESETRRRVWQLNVQLLGFWTVGVIMVAMRLSPRVISMAVDSPGIA